MGWIQAKWAIATVSLVQLQIPLHVIPEDPIPQEQYVVKISGLQLEWEVREVLFP